MPCSSSSTMHSFRTALLLTIPTWFTQFTLPTDRLAGQRSLCKIHHPYTGCLHISHCSPPVPPWPFVLTSLSQKPQNSDLCAIMTITSLGRPTSFSERQKCVTSSSSQTFCPDSLLAQSLWSLSLQCKSVGV